MLKDAWLSHPVMLGISTPRSLSGSVVLDLVKSSLFYFVSPLNQLQAQRALQGRAFDTPEPPSLNLYAVPMLYFLCFLTFFTLTLFTSKPSLFRSAQL